MAYPDSDHAPLGNSLVQEQLPIQTYTLTQRDITTKRLLLRYHAC